MYVRYGIPEHGQREKCMEKAVLFGAQLLEAPQAEFAESWTLDKTYLAC